MMRCVECGGDASKGSAKNPYCVKCYIARFPGGFEDYKKHMKNLGW